jgi:hypothetical protein
MRTFVITLTVLFFNLTILKSQSSGRVDFSGVDQFWKLVGAWENDRQPSEAQWKALFQTPGYRYLVEIEKKEGFFRKYFPLVFMPSRRGELEAELEGLQGYDKMILEHYIRIRENREELENFQRELAGRDLHTQALKKTEVYLPRGLVQHHDPPPVYFAFFEPDGKANGEVIVIDLLFARSIDLTGFIGHEAHHFYKAKISRHQLPKPEHEDYPLVRSIVQLQTEGVADLIDKRGIHDVPEPNWYQRHYQQYFRESNDRFRRIDSLITDMTEQPGKRRKNGEEIWELLPFGAHPNGQFMALLIEEELGRKALIRKLDNAFAFFRQYNKAAKRRPEAYVFSREAQRVIRRLERRYVKD